MPAALLRACVGPGCTALTDSRLCPACHAVKGNARARGYTSRWDVYRRRYLQSHPRCGDRAPGAPLTSDSICVQQGYVTPARVVDHIVPVSGPHDPSFFVPEAHQALCDPCHNAKRQRESRR
jgi:5-methylcytosine-specific restriction protein A